MVNLFHLLFHPSGQALKECLLFLIRIYLSILSQGLLVRLLPKIYKGVLSIMYWH